MKKRISIYMLLFCLAGSMCACGNSSMGANGDAAAADNGESRVQEGSTAQTNEADGAVEEIEEEPTAFEQLFSNGPIPVQDEGGLWGYIDMSGSYVIAPSFSEAKCFWNNGMALVQDAESQLWGLIDVSGSYAVEPVFSHIGDSFCDDLLRVRVEESGWGYINRAGEMVIEPQFMVAKDFSQGFARVSTQISKSSHIQWEQNSYYQYGYINTSGEWITEDIFPEAYNFSEGLALVKVGDYFDRGCYAYIDTSGEFVIEPYQHDYEEATSFCNGRAFGKVYVATERGEWFYYELIDKEGNTLLKVDSDDGESLQQCCGASTGERVYFDSGLQAVRSPDGTGYVYIDLDGNVVLPSASGEYYGAAGRFRNGCAAVQDAANSLYGYISLDGSWMIPPQYAYAGEFFTGGYAAAQDVTGNWGVIDMEGNWVVQPQYTLVTSPRANGMTDATVWDENGGKAVVIDLTGNCTWELDGPASVSLDSPDRLMVTVTEWNENGTEWKNHVSFHNRDGSVAIASEFEESDGFASDYSFAKVKYEGLWGIIDKDGNWLIPARFLAFG